MSDTQMPTEKPETVETSPEKPKSFRGFIKTGFHWGGLLSFWGWNVIGAMVVVFLILPYLFIPLVTFVFNGTVPLSIFLCIVGLMVLPFIAMWMGGTRKISVPALLFGIELPLFVLLMMRMFLMREMTFASTFLICSALLAVGLFTWGHLRLAGSDGSLPRGALYRRLSPLMLVVGAFVGVLSALYALPLFGNLIKLIFEFFTFKWVQGFYWGGSLFALLVMTFVFVTMFVFIMFPIYVAVYYPALWKKANEAPSKEMPKSNLLGYAFGFALVWMGVHGVSSLQPHANYVTELEAMPVAERVESVESPGKVQKRLLHAYLNEYRYLGREGTSNNLDVTYRRTFGSNFGHVPQNIQNHLLAPLLYKGERDDKQVAGKLYQEIFDVSIQRDFKDEIAKALKTTYNRDDIEAGLMNIGARNVALTEQNITVDDKGDHAVVLIEEVYKNLTSENQEIFYYFSLPADAALTGVWIGQTADRNEMDAYIVAPRGAAQEVYERSVRRNIDPALLEQVGPRQYRLRVFPIPVPWTEFGTRRDREFEPMRLHMEVTVPRTETGFVLPKLLEKRNIDWTWRTKRTLNGKRTRKVKDWMPSHVAAKSVDSVGKITIDTVAGYSVVGTPQAEPHQKENLSLAVLVDTSYSMRDVEDELAQNIEALSTWAKENAHSVEYFLSFATDDMPKRQIAFDPRTLKPYGQVTASEQIRDFEFLAAGVTYDAFIILTDQGTYGVESPKRSMEIQAPLWFIHVGLPAYAYDDHMLDLIYRSGGGIAEGFDDFKRRINYAKSNTIVGDSHVWTITANEKAADTASSLSSLAAKQIIAQAARGQSPTPQALDGLHTIAKTHSVVTPYSSMIVLVNERQKQALKDASEREDRFERESKPGEETLQSPNQPLVSGVPEPHEWLLIFLSVILLGYAYRNRERWDRLV